jgi:hypothetical protein
VAQPFSDPCGAGVINAEPCPRELGREIPAPRRRIVLAACVLASSMAFIDSSVLTVALPSLRPARSEAQYTVGYTAILGERLLFFRDFAFELSHAPFELFNHTIKLLDGSVDVVAENF